MNDDLAQDALADLVRSWVAPRAPRYGLDYADFTVDWEEAQDS